MISRKEVFKFPPGAKNFNIHIYHDDPKLFSDYLSCTALPYTLSASANCMSASLIYAQFLTSLF